MSSTELVALDNATHALEQLQQMGAAVAEMTSADDVMGARAWAIRLQAEVKAQRLSDEAARAAAELKLRAERRLGEMLAEVVQHGGNASSRGANLDDLGINKDESSRWQKLARVPRHDFESYFATAAAERLEVTQAGALRLAPSTRKPYAPSEVLATPAVASIRIDHDMPIGGTEHPGNQIPTGARVKITLMAKVTGVRRKGDNVEYTIAVTDDMLSGWLAPDGTMFDGVEIVQYEGAA